MVSAGKFQFASRKFCLWLITRYRKINNREFKMPWLQRQWERQKSNCLTKQNNNFARASQHFFVHSLLSLHAVAVQWWQRNVQKRNDAHVELLFCQSKPIAFLPFLLMLPLSLLKLPIHVLMGQLNKVHFHFAGSELVDWVMANLSIEDRGSKLTLFMNTFFTKRNEQRHK